MAYHPLVSTKRAKVISYSLLLIGLAIVIFTAQYVALTLAIGIPLALKQYLLGKRYEALQSFAIFVGAFIVFQFNLPWEIILPIILVVAAIFLISREFLESKTPDESEEEEDQNLTIEEKDE